MEYVLTSAAPEGEAATGGGNVHTVFINTAGSTWGGATLQIQVAPNKNFDDFTQTLDLEFSSGTEEPKNFVVNGFFRPALVGGSGATVIVNIT